MSSELDKQAVLEAIEGLTASGTGWVRTYCPFCGSTSQKLSVNVGGGPYHGYYQCWKPSCGKRGFFTERVKEKKSARVDNQVQLMPGFIPLTTESGALNKRRLEKYRTYLYGRGVSQDIIDAKHIGACEAGKLTNYVVVPFIECGAVVGYGARSIYEKRYHYPDGWTKELHPYNLDALTVETHMPLLIVEGFFDALPHDPFAMALGGQPTEYHWYEVLPKAKRPLVMALDADMQIKNELGADLLRLHGVNCKFLPLPPGTDPGGTSREKVLRKAFSLFPESFQ